MTHFIIFAYTSVLEQDGEGVGRVTGSFAAVQIQDGSDLGQESGDGKVSSRVDGYPV